MQRSREGILLFAVLLAFWLLLNGSVARDVLVVGSIASAIIVLLLPGSASFLTGFRATPSAIGAAILYFLYFLKELIKSNLRLAAIVLSPSLPVHPGIVKVRTRLKSPMARLLLANSITLTPGTLTVELRDEWLFIHWVTTESTDIEAATANIVAGFERYLEVMYG